MGDTTQSFFFSPNKVKPGAPIWAVGPALLLPTTTDDLLGTEKWGAGPTVLTLKQVHVWTYGALASHLSSFAALIVVRSGQISPPALVASRGQGNQGGDRHE